MSMLTGVRASACQRALLLAAGIAGFAGVLIGAFGAHGLERHLTREMLAIYQTGVQYHLVHAIALLGAAIIAGTDVGARSRLVPAAGWFLLAGIVVFSGSLYALAITGQRWLGMITPFGGVSFLVGWALLALTAWRMRSATNPQGC